LAKRGKNPDEKRQGGVKDRSTNIPGAAATFGKQISTHRPGGFRKRGTLLGEKKQGPGSYWGKSGGLVHLVITANVASWWLQRAQRWGKEDQPVWCEIHKPHNWGVNEKETNNLGKTHRNKKVNNKIQKKKNGASGKVA